jgi:dUTP pyrophosphatase
MTNISFKKMHPNAILPTKAHMTDVGYDLYACENVSINLGINSVNTGIVIADFETNGKNLFMKIEGRSSLAKRGVFPVGGIIDPGYRGELIVMLACLDNINDWFGERRIRSGERIAQLVFYNVENDVKINEVDQVTQTDRGDKGFGSSGK